LDLIEKVWTPEFNTSAAHYLCAETAFQSPVFVGLSKGVRKGGGWGWG